jgi:regulator of protease activity HflC (stomatin/prohibitin superfamily)
MTKRAAPAERRFDEVEADGLPGLLAIGALALAQGAFGLALYASVTAWGGALPEQLRDLEHAVPSDLLFTPGFARIVISAVASVFVMWLWTGLFVVDPNEAKVLQRFGSYVGTVRAPGLRWTNPLHRARKLSLRVRNFETATLKVNDADSNPIEVGCVVVWRVVDTAHALFEVDDYTNYVKVQSEAALRSLATEYPYDDHGHGKIALATHTAKISASLREAVQSRLERAGVEIVEARISHLAYAPEIAAAMLQRQQATAVVAARRRIVEGAVGMVELALDQLAERSVVHLSPDHKASMVSNLLVVLCSDRAAQPTVDAGHRAPGQKPQR